MKNFTLMLSVLAFSVVATLTFDYQRSATPVGAHHLPQVPANKTAKPVTAKAVSPTPLSAVVTTRRSLFESQGRELAHLATRNGLAAVEALKRLSPGHRTLLLPDVLTNWAKASPREALAWYRDHALRDELPGGISAAGSSSLIDAAISALTIESPAAALAELKLLETYGERDQGVSALVQTAVIAEQEGQLPQVLSQLPDDLRYNGLSHALAMLPSFSESKALALFNALPDEDRQHLLPAIGGGMLQANPEYGATWWLDQTKEGDRANTASAIATQWAARQPSGASRWLSTLSPGPIRDAAVESFASSSLEREPEAALQWANTISDPDLRATTLTNLHSVLNSTVPQP